jgi:tetratricopeptide (TPR) repeat protein
MSFLDRNQPEKLEQSKRIAIELEQDLIRYRVRIAVLGVLFIALIFGFIHLARKKAPQAPKAPANYSTELSVVPNVPLPEDEKWVIAHAPHIVKFLNREIKNPLSPIWIKNAAYHLIVGQISSNQGQYEKASNHLKRVLEIFPEIQQVQGALGASYLREGKPKLAIDHLRVALEEGATFSVLNNLGAALLEIDEIDEAESQLLKALEMNSDNPGCNKNLAFLYRKKELPEQAIPHFDLYFATHPNDVLTAELYASYLVESDQLDLAREFLTQASVASPEKATDLYLILAKTESQTTNATPAVAALQQVAHHLTPHTMLTKMNMQEFDPIRETDEFQALEKKVEIAAITLRKNTR